MEGENVILEEILHKIHEIKIGDYVDASDFLLKILSPSKPGEQDLLEDLRAGFRNRVIEPCFSKLEDIFQDLEKRHQSKDSQIYQLLDPLKSSDFQKYQQQVAKVLDQNLKTLKYPAASPIVSKILADPLNLVELSGLYQKKAKDVFDKQLDGLNTTIEIPKDSVQSAADTVSLGKNAKDVVPVAKNPIVNSSLENIPAEKQQADLNANNSWSIGAANNLLEKPVKEKQQANLEAEAIEVTLSEKSLKDLKELLFAVEQPKNVKSVTKENIAEESGGSGLLSVIPIVGGLAALLAKSATDIWEKDSAGLQKVADSYKKAHGVSQPGNIKFAENYYKDIKEGRVKLHEYKQLPGAPMPYSVEKDVKTKEDEIEALQEKRKDLQTESSDLNGSVLGVWHTILGDREELGNKIRNANEQALEITKIIDKLRLEISPTRSTPLPSIIPDENLPSGQPKPTEPLIQGGGGEDRLPDNTRAQINIDGYKVVPPQLGNIESDKVFGKMDLEDISKQFSKVLSPMFGRMYDILTSINDNTTGSGDNIVNNISSTDNSSSGNSGPMQSGRDPIADFRANYWRDSSSSTRYTS